jgi:hypothetical protein
MRISIEVSPSGGFVLRQGTIILGEIPADQSTRLSVMQLSIATGLVQVNPSQQQTTILTNDGQG